MNRCVRALLSLWFLPAAVAPCLADGGGDVAWVRSRALEAPPLAGGMGESILAVRYLVGMEVVEASFDDLDAGARPVAPGFFASTDPAYDPFSGRLLFAGKASATSPLQIWEWTGEGSEPRPVFRVDADCVQPIALPGGGVAFASLAAGEYDEHGESRSFSLWSWMPGDREPTRLTHSPSSEFEPAILPDGRLLYSSWQHVGASWPRGNVALLLVNSDGTGIFPYHGNHRGDWMKRGATATDTEIFAHIESVELAPFGAGRLVFTNRNDSFSDAAGATALDGYEVADVEGLPGAAWLLSARRAGGGGRFGLHLLEGGELRPLRLLDDEHALAPAVREKGFEPDLRFSTVVPGTEHAYLLVLDVHETDRPLRAGAAPPPYRRVRVIEGLADSADRDAVAFHRVEGRAGEPALSSRSGVGKIRSRILGEVEPEEDGSVYLKVPADRPLRIQLVDADGFAARDERAWFWLRPNERRVCIGCHEDRELTPSNEAALAASREPADLTDPARWQEVSYVRHIRPIIRKTCAVASCHMAPNPTAAMNLSSTPCQDDTEPEMAAFLEPAYANLLARQPGKPFEVGGRRVHVGDARSSPLIWMLYGRPLAPQYEDAPFDRPMSTPHPGPMLSDEELDLFRKWIDLGAVYGVPDGAGQGIDGVYSKRED